MMGNLLRGTAVNAEMQAEEFVICCGGMKPIIIPEGEGKEEEECTEQF